MSRFKDAVDDWWKDQLGETYFKLDYDITATPEYNEMCKNYCANDVKMTFDLAMMINAKKTMEIKNVIFNDPATIVFWNDGAKTVVKTQDGEKYDPEKGLAMAISKKALGNKRSYYNTFDKWLKKYEADHEVFNDIMIGIEQAEQAMFLEALKNFNKSFK